jgi:uncharacterized protein (TIGR02444 family)
LHAALENPLWAFSLAVYPEAGVSEECIALQDECGVDVNLLLFCAYVGGVRGVTLSQPDLLGAAEAVAHWHAEVVRPLRAVRRALKPIAEDAAQTLRARIKADELLAEQIEQATLWRWACERLAAREAGDRSAALAANIASLLGGRPAPNLAAAVLRHAGKI